MKCYKLLKESYFFKNNIFMDISKEILSRIKNTLGKNDVNVHLHEPSFLNTNA